MPGLPPELVLAIVKRKAFRLIVAHKHGTRFSVDHFGAFWDSNAEDGIGAFGACHMLSVRGFQMPRQDRLPGQQG